MDVASPLYDTPSARRWHETLRVRPDWAGEIDSFETELRLKRNGKIEDKVFAETRLRRGIYGQRYDNGRRHDGKTNREIPYPDRHILKGPATLWHAPGMQRIKIPYGGMSAAQMETVAELAEEYADGVLHLTTRQDIQIHFVHIEDTPAIFRRLAAAGITTREACGNTVRNVTACPMAGVCAKEVFDTTPHADAMFKFLLGHPDTQDFGRKFKIAFSGCADSPCALARIHDIGFIAKTREEGGGTRRGFSMLVGGGLGPVPYHAQVFGDFVPEGDILPLAQAICRVFTVHGEKKNRNRARMKFLVADWGLEKFRAEVLKERANLAPDPRWAVFPPPDASVNATVTEDNPDPAGASLGEAFARWRAANVSPQKQAGLAAVTVPLPLGDITAERTRELARFCRRFSPERARVTQAQNLLLRGVRESDLPALFSKLEPIGLAEPEGDTMTDITACPGTDTCRLGVSSSRGLASALREEWRGKALGGASGALAVKISGCFNSCGQHHAADIGLYGVGRKVGNYLVPHFQILLGGTRAGNAAAYGTAVVAIPSKAVPEAVRRLTAAFEAEGGGGDFRAWVNAKGKAGLKALLGDLTEVPPHETAPEYYVDYSDVREYSKSDIGTGECAGEVVSPADFGLKAAECRIFEAHLAFEAGDLAGAWASAVSAMVSAAEGLVKLKEPFTTGTAAVEAAFVKLYCDTKVFHDPFAGDKFAKYFLKAVHEGAVPAGAEAVRRRLDEAQLFIDAAHAYLARVA